MKTRGFNGSLKYDLEDYGDFGSAVLELGFEVESYLPRCWEHDAEGGECMLESVRVTSATVGEDARPAVKEEISALQKLVDADDRLTQKLQEYCQDNAGSAQDYDDGPDPDRLRDEQIERRAMRAEYADECEGD